MTAEFLPELLSPAGSKDAFRAAVDGGADAIYVGGTSFNARINAKNFTAEELSECIRLAHAYGIKVYVTLNTLLFDRERDELLRASESAAQMGADAFIVADLGVVSLLRSHMPEMELHASTQMSVHNSLAGNALRDMGISRVVPARELSLSDIKAIVDEGSTEVEIFTHGALCVSHSGQCLFSSVVGGRSGNRGLCAQPCRLPYSPTVKNPKANEYPLSLKDLSLCNHVEQILDCGVHSLKIEGRMKSPEYVRTVTSVWRRLLDERRSATPEETKRLADIFSRGGFTDGYFSKNINKSMLGIRTEADKLSSLDTDKFRKISRKLPISMSVTLYEGTPSILVLKYKSITVCVEGDLPMPAINAPIDRENVTRSLSKLGDTPFEAQSIEVALGENVMMPISRLNDLRRLGISRLTEVLAEKKIPEITGFYPDVSDKKRKKQNIGRFLFPAQITRKAKDYFDKTFLPLERYDGIADGFVLPPVILDSELDAVKALIDKAITAGASCAMVGNVGNLSLLCDRSLEIFGDFRFNVTNSYTLKRLEDMGVSTTILSPELTLPQMRDIGGDAASIVYGSLPLMTLEKCMLRDLYGCDACNRYVRDCEGGRIFAPLKIKDRKGISFPVVREWQHRNVIYNSIPTCMSDKEKELVAANIRSRVFIFTVESQKEVDAVIDAYISHSPLGIQVRRI